MSHKPDLSLCIRLLSSYPLKAVQGLVPLLQEPSVFHSQLNISQFSNTTVIIVFVISITELVPAAHMGVMQSEGEQQFLAQF